MKKLVILFFLTGSLFVNAQEPDFKFHLAFEDATGAKDTIWLIWDSLATTGYDTLFNEYPQSLLTDTFQVYIKYSGVDSGKVRAYPYNYSLVDFTISAQNYVYPINMYWDTALIFHNDLPFTINTAVLDNEWFFFQANDPSHPEQYSMMYEDSIQLPSFNWGSQDHFPIYFGFGYDPFLTSIDKNNLKEILIYPNPVTDYLCLRINKLEAYHISIIDGKGRLLKQKLINASDNNVDVKELPKGIYLVEIKNDYHHFIQKFIKN